MDLHIKHLASRCQNRLGIERGSFVYNQQLGSRIHQLKRAKNIAEVYHLADIYIAEALDPEMKAGFLDKISAVRVTERTVDNVNLEVDLTAGKTTFTLSVEV